MIAPLDPPTAAAYPKFDALYQDLTTKRLNADGTSRLDAKAANERDILGENLRNARLAAARRDLIKDRLHSLSYTPEALPDELQALVAIAAAVLDGDVSEEDRVLLEDDLASSVGTVTTALLDILRHDAAKLTHMIDPDQPPSLSDLPGRVAELQTSTATARQQTTETRYAIAQEASALHDVHRATIERSIRILEQTIHGSVARGTKAKADYLAFVAEGMSKKLQLQQGQLMSQLYSSEMRDALLEQASQLDRETKALKRQVREAEEKLEEYRTEAGMGSIAQEYAEILRESERVRAEIGRLEGS